MAISIYRTNDKKTFKTLAEALQHEIEKLPESIVLKNNIGTNWVPTNNPTMPNIFVRTIITDERDIKKVNTFLTELGLIIYKRSTGYVDLTEASMLKGIPSGFYLWKQNDYILLDKNDIAYIKAINLE